MIRIITLLGLAFLLASCGDEPEKEAEAETTQTPADDLATIKADAQVQITEAETKVIGIKDSTTGAVTTAASFTNFVAKRNTAKKAIEDDCTALKTLVANPAATKKDIKDKITELATKLAEAEALRTAIVAAEVEIAKTANFATVLTNADCDNFDKLNPVRKEALDLATALTAKLETESAANIETDTAALLEKIKAIPEQVKAPTTLADAKIKANEAIADAGKLPKAADVAKGFGNAEVIALIEIVTQNTNDATGIRRLNVAVAAALDNAGGITDLNKATADLRAEIKAVTDKIEEIRVAREAAQAEIDKAEGLAASVATEKDKCVHPVNYETAVANANKADVGSNGSAELKDLILVDDKNNAKTLASVKTMTDALKVLIANVEAVETKADLKIATDEAIEAAKENGPHHEAIKAAEELFAANNDDAKAAEDARNKFAAAIKASKDAREAITKADAFNGLTIAQVKQLTNVLEGAIDALSNNKTTEFTTAIQAKVNADMLVAAKAAADEATKVDSDNDKAIKAAIKLHGDNDADKFNDGVVVDDVKAAFKGKFDAAETARAALEAEAKKGDATLPSIETKTNELTTAMNELATATTEFNSKLKPLAI